VSNFFSPKTPESVGRACVGNFAARANDAANVGLNESGPRATRFQCEGISRREEMNLYSRVRSGLSGLRVGGIS
jgi:hypothetical protein